MLVLPYGLGRLNLRGVQLYNEQPFLEYVPMCLIRCVLLYMNDILLACKSISSKTLIRVKQLYGLGHFFDQNKARIACLPCKHFTAAGEKLFVSVVPQSAVPCPRAGLQRRGGPAAVRRLQRR